MEHILGLKEGIRSTIKPNMPTIGRLAKALPPHMGVDAMRRAKATPRAQERPPQQPKVAILPALVSMPRANKLPVSVLALESSDAHRSARTRPNRIYSWSITTSSPKTYALTWVVTPPPATPVAVGWWSATVSELSDKPSVVHKHLVQNCDSETIPVAIPASIPLAIDTAIAPIPCFCSFLVCLFFCFCVCLFVLLFFVFCS